MKRTRLTTIACLTASMALAPHFSIADPEGQVFDPKAYGAVGDGVADDTAAFASVVAAATKRRPWSTSGREPPSKPQRPGGRCWPGRG